MASSESPAPVDENEGVREVVLLSAENYFYYECFIKGGTLVVFTDGSCLNNGIPGLARAGCGIWWGHNSPHNRSYRVVNGLSTGSGCEQSNNRAEIWAAIYAIHQAKYEFNCARLVLYTDSYLLIDANSIALGEGQATKKQATRFQVPIDHLSDVFKKIKVKFRHVYAHSNDLDLLSRGNSGADALAKEGAASYRANVGYHGEVAKAQLEP